MLMYVYAFERACVRACVCVCVCVEGGGSCYSCSILVSGFHNSLVSLMCEFQHLPPE